MSASPPFAESDWQRLLPDEDYRFRIGVRQGNARRFFAGPAGSDSPRWLEARARALDLRPNHYVAATPDALPFVSEAVQAMMDCRAAAPLVLPDDPVAACLAAARRIESDWVVLSPDAVRKHPVAAGAVCFPSSWSLPEKLGLPITGVHEPVPALNASIGGAIDTFLNRLMPAVAWERENWGLAADEELDHHPSRPRQGLDEHATLNGTWLRWERQLLMRLPATGAILFGIKVTTHRLDAIVRMPGIGRRLARALRTMPEPVAVYKGLARCRDALVRQLEP